MLKDFKKVVRLGTLPMYAGTGRMSVYCKIEFKEGRLSITGVEGPKTNGDAAGSCGQIVMSLREPKGLDGYEPAPGWTLETVQTFLEYWDEWHLNDMRAYDAEMEAAGWPELAKKPMLGYSFTLTKEAYDAKKAAEAAALKALREGGTFEPTARQVADATRPGSYTVWTYADEPAPEPIEGYERQKDLWGHNKGNLKHPERKTLGWLYPKEHPDGLLTRKLREDGPGYGSAHFKHEVPEEVLAFLQALPDTDIKPAWV